MRDWIRANPFLAPFLRWRRVFLAARRLQSFGIPILPFLWHAFRLREDWLFWRRLVARLEGTRKVSREERLGGWVDFTVGSLIYAVVRTKKPTTVVETGVGGGLTSFLILKALEENQLGHLYSVDLPGRDAEIYPEMGRRFDIQVPAQMETGWIVPDRLRQRWTLLLGDSLQVLPGILAKVKSVDIFLHDSLHTDEHIRKELSMVLPQMRSGGVLLADDVNEGWSLEFPRYCSEKALPNAVVCGRLGVAVNWSTIKP